MVTSFVLAIAIGSNRLLSSGVDLALFMVSCSAAVVLPKEVLPEANVEKVEPVYKLDSAAACASTNSVELNLPA